MGPCLWLSGGVWGLLYHKLKTFVLKQVLGKRLHQHGAVATMGKKSQDLVYLRAGFCSLHFGAGVGKDLCYLAA